MSLDFIFFFFSSWGGGTRRFTLQLSRLSLTWIYAIPMKQMRNFCFREFSCSHCLNKHTIIFMRVDFFNGDVGRPTDWCKTSLIVNSVYGTFSCVTLFSSTLMKLWYFSQTKTWGKCDRTHGFPSLADIFLHFHSRTPDSSSMRGAIRALTAHFSNLFFVELIKALPKSPSCRVLTLPLSAHSGIIACSNLLRVKQICYLEPFVFDSICISLILSFFFDCLSIEQSSKRALFPYCCNTWWMRQTSISAFHKKGHLWKAGPDIHAVIDWNGALAMIPSLCNAPWQSTG